MPGQRPVASFAAHVGVLAIFFLFKDVGMAGFTGLMPSEIHGTGGDVHQSVAPIMPILPEALGNEKAPEHQEQHRAGDEDACQAKKMSCILKGIHGVLTQRIVAARHSRRFQAAESGCL